MYMEVVGESHYHKNFKRLVGRPRINGHREYLTATLELENNNKYDRNAVVVKIAGLTVGYLDRETAKDFRRYLKNKHVDYDSFLVDCVVCGGRTGQNYGVYLDVRKTLKGEYKVVYTGDYDDNLESVEGRIKKYRKTKIIILTIVVVSGLILTLI